MLPRRVGVDGEVVDDEARRVRPQHDGGQRGGGAEEQRGGEDAPSVRRAHGEHAPPFRRRRRRPPRGTARRGRRSRAADAVYLVLLDVDDVRVARLVRARGDGVEREPKAVETAPEEAAGRARRVARAGGGPSSPPWERRRGGEGRRRRERRRTRWRRASHQAGAGGARAIWREKGTARARQRHTLLATPLLLLDGGALPGCMSPDAAPARRRTYVVGGFGAWDLFTKFVFGPAQ